jgi:hypothetical protein
MTGLTSRVSGFSAIQANVPCAAISRIARMTAPSAARLSSAPTLIRATPSSPNCASVYGLRPGISTFTGRETACITAARAISTNGCGRRCTAGTAPRTRARACS